MRKNFTDKLNQALSIYPEEERLKYKPCTDKLDLIFKIYKIDTPNYIQTHKIYKIDTPNYIQTQRNPYILLIKLIYEFFNSHNLTLLCHYYITNETNTRLSFMLELWRGFSGDKLLMRLLKWKYGVDVIYVDIKLSKFDIVRDFTKGFEYINTRYIKEVHD